MSGRHGANNSDRASQEDWAREKHEVAERRMSRLIESPTHVPAIATLAEFIDKSMSELVWRYMVFWQAFICKRSRAGTKSWPIPQLSRVGDGSGRTSNDPIFYTCHAFSQEIFLVDDGLGGRAWVRRLGNQVLRFHERSTIAGPFPELLWDARNNMLRRTYTEWQEGRYSAPDPESRPHPWTIDSHSPHLTEGHLVELRNPAFSRIVWKMVGPSRDTPRGPVDLDPAVPVEQGDRWHPTTTYHVLTLWHDHADGPVYVAVRFTPPHEPGTREPGSTVQVFNT